MVLTLAFLAADLANYGQRDLLKEVESGTLWTDSISVLKFARDTSSQDGTFVVNRLSSIHYLSGPNYRRYVEIKRDPADSTTGGMHPKDRITGEKFNGPRFLWKDKVACLNRPKDFNDRTTHLNRSSRHRYSPPQREPGSSINSYCPVLEMHSKRKSHSYKETVVMQPYTTIDLIIHFQTVNKTNARKTYCALC
ncbi:hypothetical protein P879_05961 [Paragonimus westermani]|uniref:Uncharacterized protein n=1 Tax=Paragonimus westermani TaxID=34504 RepID=A0A8T0DH71_9TREM|nr:hypothetical protein P879_05961 [Paragonimus westermani]